MKKLLLLTLALAIGFTAISQIATVSKDLLSKAEKVPYHKPISDLGDFSAGVNPTVRNYALEPSEEIIGETWYDAWTNATCDSRFYRYDDGSMVATWTRGMEATTFPDRGTGYNYYDGSAWQPMPTARIESVRTGWGTNAPLGLNGEIVVAHNGSNLEISKRDTRFTGEWQESSYVGVAQPTWPKIVASGDENQYLHVFYHTYTAYNGMPGSIIYTRTANGGTTWDPQDVILPGMGPEDIFKYQSEEFAVASKGDIVALFICGAWEDMFIMKSLDNGDTWEKIMVREHPFPFWDFATMTMLDTIFTCDNSGSIAIDNNGKCHVVFGLTRVMVPTITSPPGGYNYFPFVDGVGYWNEDMPPFSNDLSALAGPQYGYETSEMIEDYNYIGWTQDVDGDGEITFITTPTGFPMSYPSIGLSTMPTITIDDEGRIFVAFASTTETYDNFEYNFKKIWARAFANGSWGTFVHVTANIIHIFDESVYPMLASTSDGDIHMIYNTDASPGYAVNTPPDHDFQTNSVWYSAIPKEDLVGIKDNTLINAASVSQNYPNPFDGKTTITVNLPKAANLSMKISNILGQQVMDMQRGYVSAGTYYFQVDGTKLQDGVYFYTVKANNSEVTKKMIVR
jgi:hypothetical protein